MEQKKNGYILETFIILKIVHWKLTFKAERLNVMLRGLHHMWQAGSDRPVYLLSYSQQLSRRASILQPLNEIGSSERLWSWKCQYK